MPAFRCPARRSERRRLIRLPIGVRMCQLADLGCRGRAAIQADSARVARVPTMTRVLPIPGSSSRQIHPVAMLAATPRVRQSPGRNDGPTCAVTATLCRRSAPAALRVRIKWRDRDAGRRPSRQEPRQFALRTVAAWMVGIRTSWNVPCRT